MRILWSAPAASARPPSPSPPAAPSSSSWWSPTTTSARAERAVAGPRTTASSPPRSTPRRPTRSPRCAASTAITHVLNAVDPRFVMPIFDGRVRGRRRLPRHGDVAVPPAPGPPVRRDAASSSATSSSPRPTHWEAAGRLALVGIGVEPGLSDVFARYAADELFAEIDEIGVRDGANLTVDGYDFAPVVLHLDHHRGVPQPAGDLGGGPRLVHHRAVQRAGGLRLPRGHRPGRVRQRGARGGAADPALGRRAAGHLQVRPRRRVHRRAQDAAQARPGPHRAGRACGGGRRSRRATWSPPACPTRPRSATGCAARPAPAPGSRGTGTDGSPREVYLYHVVDNEWSMREYGSPGRGLADRDQPGRRAGTARRRHLVRRRRARPGGVRRRCRSWTCSPSTAPRGGCER